MVLAGAAVSGLTAGCSAEENDSGCGPDPTSAPAEVGVATPVLVSIDGGLVSGLDFDGHRPWGVKRATGRYSASTHEIEATVTLGADGEVVLVSGDWRATLERWGCG